MKKTLLLLPMLLSLLCVSPAWALTLTAQEREVDKLLDSWHMKKAERLLGALPKAESPAMYYLKARRAFFLGTYPQALELANKALSLAGGKDAELTVMRDLIKDTQGVVATYERHTSPKGYFEIALPPGKDRVLLPYAFEALDRAYEVLGEELGHKPATPIRVEVYPNALTLAKVSSLTENDIRTTGTIALCKYNRLMFTTPNALLQGYGWVDTMVHEYVHYVINHRVLGNVPIWMHEGLAKYLERVWRDQGKHILSPSSEHLLQTRFAAGKLVTFDQMHPSMAKLPSAEDAAVAYAEVYTVIEHLHQTKGAAGLQQMLTFIDQGMDARDAYARALGTTFSNFEKRLWPELLKKRPKVPYAKEAGFSEELRFKDRASEQTELAKIPKPAARDHANLGNLLQARGRFGAAALQYRKAIHIMGDKNPMLQTRLAQCLMETKKPAEAMRVLEPVRKMFPSYVSTWLELGKAAVALARWESAREYLLEAARINPFDPEIHVKLALTFDQLGDKARAKQERAFGALVR